MKPVDIAGREIGPGHPCFIIAEAGVNHNGDLELARRLVEVAAEAGADAVKFQTFNAEEVVSPAAPKAAYQLQGTSATESQLDMVRQLELSARAHRELQALCQARSILFLSTPFDIGSADLLTDMGVPAFKIGSGEITNIPFLEYLARKGKPLLLSTGMSYLGEVDVAVRAVRRAGCDQLVLLHCVSNYPASAVDANLRALHTMAAAFQLPVGYSDHTTGLEVSLAAVALGACVLEKHFTLDRSLTGPDHRASLQPEELAALVRGIRTVEAALGDGDKQPAASELDTAAVARRSLVAACRIPAHTVLTEQMLTAQRPGTGLPPAASHYLIGRAAARDIPAGTVLSLEMLL